jgi:hypothetical protein
MSIFEKNVKMRTLEKTDDLKCECGSVRYTVKVYTNDVGERRWVAVHCKACGAFLFYNGA